MNGWSLIYRKFEPEHEMLHEALCTLGNGYFATRGAAEESRADDVHYPGTYLAGGYNRLESSMAGRVVTNEDLVNFPNWLPLTFRPEGGDWLNLMAVDVISYRQELNMRHGVLKRTVRFQDHQGRESTVVSRRLVHMSKPHLAGIEYSITAVNWSGQLTVRSAIDGSVVNDGVARYRGLNSKHLETLDTGQTSRDTFHLLTQTNQSHLQMAQAVRTRAYRATQELHPARQTVRDESVIGQELEFDIAQGETVTVEKLMALYTSRDQPISEPCREANNALTRGGRFASLLESHKRAWAALWRKCDVEVRVRPPGNEQIISRLHIFHLLQTVSPNTIGLDVGVPARGWHGEAYRGHVFWDELFIFPFYTFRIPEITRSLLLYRYRRLDAARREARKAGYQGAMYPWQSGSSGSEETQVLHLNPRSGTWGTDYSRYQRHVNIAITYNVWLYYLLTGDREFMSLYGAEIMLEIARFWSSATTFNETTGRFEIHGVMGPDEYHEKYPNDEQPGLKNNAYTNVMVVWLLERALEVLNLLAPERRRELSDALELQPAETDQWRRIICKMVIPFHDDGIISQFEGYENLEEFDWGGYSKKYGNISRLDRILKAEGDSPDRYQCSKQADVLMLLFMLPRKVLRRIFLQLGYNFDDTIIRKNVDYYLKRTTHGSTLSKVVHASLLDHIDRKAAWSLFCEALQSDISDVQGGTTPEGIHLGAMAGTVDIMLRHYAGIDTTGEIIAFHPRLPEYLHGLHLRLRHRSFWYELDLSHERFVLGVDTDGPGPATVRVDGQLIELTPGSSQEFPLTPTVSDTAT